ncbi:MAG TPA: signal peptidase I [Pyrinomonadaceae bacterium]|nr:signal peptidase I [Pyrinomonadaceae bacterium]
MMNNPSREKVSDSARESKTEKKPFSFSRIFNRNGHNHTPPVEVKPQGPPKSVLREYFESAVVTVIMALFGMTFIVQAVKVPTGSMQNTITIGDHLLVNKFIFAPGASLPFLPQREIKRGDIIVFKYPGNKYDPRRDERPDNKPIVTNYVKRVVGIPGDRLSMEGRNVLVNGKPLPEHQIEAVDNNDKAPLIIEKATPRPADKTYDVYYNPDFTDEEYPIFKLEGDGKEIVIPEGKYFVMGDNRNNSEDSRYWGFVPRDLVIGRAMFVYWSFDESAPSNGFLMDFFTNTRWSRTGTMVK